MPEITVTETQRERLAAIQDDIEAAYIDTYGHIRTKDVVQYLLDTYTPPEQQGSDVTHERVATADFGALQAVATEVEGVPGSGIDAATMRGELVSALGVEAFAERLAAVEDAENGDGASERSDAENGTEDGADSSADGSPSSAGESAAATQADGEPDDEAAAADETDADGAVAEDDTDACDGTADDSDGAASTSGSTAATDGPGAVLSAANQLLTDHEDKWREGGSDSPYEVDLPDGTTEKVRTKDDVRGLLFKHY
jgi:hypothetical protein